MTLPRSIYEMLNEKWPQQGLAITLANDIFSHLSELASKEFDEGAFNQWFEDWVTQYPNIAYSEFGRSHTYMLMHKAARRQHALDMAALLKEREDLAAAKAEIERLEEKYNDGAEEAIQEAMEKIKW